MQKKRVLGGRRAQMHIPFEMIFSLMLIAVFLFVVFFVIQHFLEVQRCAQIGLLVRDFQDRIDEIWNAQEASTTFEAEMPFGLEYACFADLRKGMNLVGLPDAERETASEIYEDLKLYFKYRDANFFLYPWQKACNMAANNIKHVNLANTTNPYCFAAAKGKIKIKLAKGLYDALVKPSK